MRKVIDNFEDIDIFHNTMGGEVSIEQMNAYIADAEDLADSPHDTQILVMEPDSEGASVLWEIDAPGQNAAAYKTLSFRIAKLGPDGPLPTIKIGLSNAGQKTRYVYLNDYGTISPFGRMNTVRIPLADFDAHNAVTAISLEFTTLSAEGETYILDSLEFSEAALGVIM
ncbi:MAG: hypothetical protein OEV42_08280 [Deltaproteobacteria bacterium]|nr:hypothetical protein [Deltaproteobacteria bacterium]